MVTEICQSYPKNESGLLLSETWCTMQQMW